MRKDTHGAMTESPAVETVTTAKAVGLLMLTEGRLRQLAKDGWFPKAVKGRYKLEPLVQGYIRFLKDEERRTSRVQADSGLKAARQREVELRIAEREGRLVELDEIKAVFVHVMATVRAELNGLPAAVTRDAKLRDEIESYMNGAFARSNSKFQEACGILQSGGDPMGSGSEDDA